MYAMIVDGKDDDERERFDRELNQPTGPDAVPGLPPAHGAQALIALMKSPMGRGQ